MRRLIACNNYICAWNVALCVDTPTEKEYPKACGKLGIPRGALYLVLKHCGIPSMQAIALAEAVLYEPTPANPKSQILRRQRSPQVGDMMGVKPKYKTLYDKLKDCKPDVLRAVRTS